MKCKKGEGNQSKITKNPIQEFKNTTKFIKKGGLKLKNKGDLIKIINKFPQDFKIAFKILQERTTIDQRRCLRKQPAVGIDKKINFTSIKFYFHKQCWSFDSSDSEEELQHSNFGHARFSQKTYHPNWKIDSSDSNDVSKTIWDRIRRRQYQKMVQRSNQTHFRRNQRSLGRMTQHVDQPSIYLQDPKKDLFHIQKKKTKKSQVKIFKIENHEDKIEMLIWKWS